MGCLQLSMTNEGLEMSGDVAEYLSAGMGIDWLTLRCLIYLQEEASRTKDNIWKWSYSNFKDRCECREIQTMDLCSPERAI